MTVPDEAVEAAAKAAYVEYSQEPGFDAEAAWEDMSGTDDWEQGLWGLVARAALTAAAPFIAAQAWGEGLAKGGHLAAWAIGNRPEVERPDTTNPYRSGT